MDAEQHWLGTAMSDQVYESVASVLYIKVELSLSATGQKETMK